jgi:hypothetical protein
MTKQELRQIIRKEWLKYDENPYLYETAFEDGFLKGYELGVNFDIMQEYAIFCVHCNREGLPLLLAKEWFEHFRDK